MDEQVNQSSTQALPQKMVNRQDQDMVQANNSNSGNKSRFIKVILWLSLIGGILYLITAYHPQREEIIAKLSGFINGSNDQAAANQALISGAEQAITKVVGLGELLPISQVITLPAPFGAGDARIKDLLVAEGDKVQAGDVLVELDNQDAFQAAYHSAQANIKVKEAILEQVIASTKAAKLESKAALDISILLEKDSKKSFDRNKILYDRKVLSEELFDKARVSYASAVQATAQNRATYSRYDYDNLDQQPDIAVARQNLEIAKISLINAGLDLEKAVLRAPISGTILKINHYMGEKPGEKGVMTLGDVSQMMVKIEVYQTAIAKVHLGDAVEITAIALPSTLHATVTEIGNIVGRQNIIDRDPASNTDARVIEVIAVLDQNSSNLASNLTYLQVNAAITTRAE